MSHLYFCPECKNLFNPAYIKQRKVEGVVYVGCPVCLHQYSELVELDDWLAPIIKDLNVLGYPTRSSCMGHYTDSVSGCNNNFIMFDFLPQIKKENIIQIISKSKLKFSVENINEFLSIRLKRKPDEMSTGIFIKELKKLLKILKES